MKLTLLFDLKGNNYYKHVEKAYNFRIKSGIGKWYIITILVDMDNEV